MKRQMLESTIIKTARCLTSWLIRARQLCPAFLAEALQPYLYYVQSVITANGRHKVPFPELVVADKPGWRQQDERRAQGLAGMLAAQISAACAAASAGARPCRILWYFGMHFAGTWAVFVTHRMWTLTFVVLPDACTHCQACTSTCVLDCPVLHQHLGKFFAQPICNEWLSQKPCHLTCHLWSSPPLQGSVWLSACCRWCCPC